MKNIFLNLLNSLNISQFLWCNTKIIFISHYFFSAIGCVPSDTAIKVWMERRQSQTCHWQDEKHWRHNNWDSRRVLEWVSGAYTSYWNAKDDWTRAEKPWNDLWLISSCLILTRNQNVQFLQRELSNKLKLNDIFIIVYFYLCTISKIALSLKSTFISWS